MFELKQIISTNENISSREKIDFISFEACILNNKTRYINKVSPKNDVPKWTNVYTL